MKLHFTHGDFAGQALEVTGERYAVGRADGNDLRVPDSDKRTSRNHAEIVRENGVWIVRDLGSANGVWLDEKEISGEAPLRDGQALRIGGQTARVSLREDATAPDAGPGTLWTGEPRPPATPPTPPKPPRERSYTVMLANADRRIRALTYLAVGAVVLALAVGGLAVAGVIGGGGGDKGLDVAALVKAATPSTLLVEMTMDQDLADAIGTKDARLGNGTGWVLDAGEGQIVTNAHVTVAGQIVRVAAPGGKPRPAKVVAINGCNDVALVQTGDTSGLRTLPQVSQRELSAGEPVVALGFPGSLAIGDNLTTTTGVISVVKTEAKDPGYPNVVQTDAAINHGNSGGPLLDARGRLVGMNTLADLADFENQAFAIATDHINSLLGELRDGTSTAWLGYVLEFPDDDDPVVTGSNGDKFYGPLVVGRAEGAPENDALVGLGGGKSQHIYAVDGTRFGPGEDELSLGAGDSAICAVAGDKHTGDTSVLSILENLPDNQYKIYDVKVTYA